MLSSTKPKSEIHFFFQVVIFDVSGRLCVPRNKHWAVSSEAAV